MVFILLLLTQLSDVLHSGPQTVSINQPHHMTLEAMWLATKLFVIDNRKHLVSKTTMVNRIKVILLVSYEKQ